MKSTGSDVAKILGGPKSVASNGSDWGNAKKTWTNAEVKRTFQAKKSSPEAEHYTPFMIADFRFHMDLLQTIYDQMDIGEPSASLINTYQKGINLHFGNPSQTTVLGIAQKSVDVRQQSNEVLAKVVNELKFGNDYTPEVYVYEAAQIEDVEIITEDDDEETKNIFLEEEV